MSRKLTSPFLSAAVLFFFIVSSAAPVYALQPTTPSAANSSTPTLSLTQIQENEKKAELRQRREELASDLQTALRDAKSDPVYQALRADYIKVTRPAYLRAVRQEARKTAGIVHAQAAEIRQLAKDHPEAAADFRNEEGRTLAEILSGAALLLARFVTQATRHAYREASFLRKEIGKQRAYMAGLNLLRSQAGVSGLSEEALGRLEEQFAALDAPDLVTLEEQPVPNTWEEKLRGLEAGLDSFEEYVETDPPPAQNVYTNAVSFSSYGGDLLDLGNGMAIASGRPLSPSEGQSDFVRIVNTQTGALIRELWNSSEGAVRFAPRISVSKDRRYVAILIPASDLKNDAVRLFDSRTKQVISRSLLLPQSKDGQTEAIDLAVDEQGNTYLLGMRQKKISVPIIEYQPCDPVPSDPGSCNFNREQIVGYWDVLKFESNFVATLSRGSNTAFVALVFNQVSVSEGQTPPQGPEGNFSRVALRDGILYVHGAENLANSRMQASILRFNRIPIAMYCPAGNCPVSYSLQKFGSVQRLPLEGFMGGGGTEISQDGKYMTVFGRNKYAVVALSDSDLDEAGHIVAQGSDAGALFLTRRTAYDHYQRTTFIMSHVGGDLQGQARWGHNPALIVIKDGQPAAAAVDMMPILKEIGKEKGLFQGDKFTPWGIAIDPVKREFILSIGEFSAHTYQNRLVEIDLDYLYQKLNASNPPPQISVLVNHHVNEIDASALINATLSRKPQDGEIVKLFYRNTLKMVGHADNLDGTTSYWEDQDPFQEIVMSALNDSEHYQASLENLIRGSWPDPTVNGQYEYYVQVLDRDGEVLSTSETKKFTLNPGVWPMLIGHQDGPIGYSDAEVKLDFADIPEGGRVKFRYQGGNSTQWNEIFLEDGIRDGRKTTATARLANLRPNSNYEWQIAILDASGREVFQMNGVQSFRTKSAILAHSISRTTADAAGIFMKIANVPALRKIRVLVSKAALPYHWQETALITPSDDWGSGEEILLERTIGNLEPNTSYVYDIIFYDSDDLTAGHVMDRIKSPLPKFKTDFVTRGTQVLATQAEVDQTHASAVVSADLSGVLQNGETVRLVYAGPDEGSSSRSIEMVSSDHSTHYEIALEDLGPFVHEGRYFYDIQVLDRNDNVISTSPSTRSFRWDYGLIE